MIDIRKPQRSVLTADLTGKTLFIYGSNRTGKTSQLTKLPKPYYLAFEAGINMIPDIDFVTIRAWEDFVSFVEQALDIDNIDWFKENYQTIILDEASVAGRMCREYICNREGSQSISKGNNGFGLWSEYQDELEKQIDMLTSIGLTVAFIGHEGTRTFANPDGTEYSKIYPAGDKRIIDPICNKVDFIGYAGVNGVDESGREIKSSLYLTNTLQYHAGTRSDYMTPFIKEFTAENLQNAIRDAITAQAKAEGTKVVTYEEAKQSEAEHQIPNRSLEELQLIIKGYAEAMFENQQRDKYIEVVEKYLGQGAKVNTATKKQVGMLELIVASLEKLAKE